MADEKAAVSFSPDDTQEGEPLFESGNAKIKASRIEIYSYENKQGEAKGEPTTGWRLVYEAKVGDETKELSEFYSIGKPDRFVPSQDGRKLLPVTDPPLAIWAKADVTQLTRAFKNSGVSETVLKAGDVGAFVGAEFHLIRVVKKDKDGAEVKNKKGYKVTMLIPDKLVQWPGEKPAAGAVKATATASAAKATTAAAAPATSAQGLDLSTVADDVRERTVAYVALSVADGPVQRKGIASKIFQAAMKAKEKPEAIKQFGVIGFDKGFLAANSGQPVMHGEEILAFNYDAEKDEISKAA